MAFKCVHCKANIDDDALKVPRSGAQCPKCKKDPTEGWSPYKPNVAKEGRKAAEEMDMRLITRGDWGVREAALWFLEDTILEQRDEVSIRLGSKTAGGQKCSVCAEEVPEGEGFRVEIYDRWRSTHIIIGLCERHAREGLWGREFDTHANHPNPWLVRGDWHYANNDGKEKG
jgi:hypothetical protein